MISSPFKLSEPLDIITQKEFQGNVRQLAEDLGWEVVGETWHSKNSPSDEPARGGSGAGGLDRVKV